MTDNFIINTKVIIGAVGSVALIIISLTFKNWTDNEAQFKSGMVNEIKVLNANMNGVTERTLRNEIQLEYVIKNAEKSEHERKEMKDAMIKQGIYPN